LIDAAVVSGPATATPIYAVDCAGGDAAYVLVRDGGGHRLAQVRVDGASAGADLTRTIRPVPAGARVSEVPGQRRPLTQEDLAAWNALGLALTSADLVGLMRGLLDLSVAYAAERRQYGVPVGSFQAVQHLLAEARCLMEGALSVALHASWAVDDLAPDEARGAGRVAKAYCARAARTVCETAVQVHGGMGNTWDCIVHVYLRRALLSSQWFGDDGEQLRELQRTRLGAADGPS
jgi:alkylation response protein AidB-like acyl-CoA dehydrogenase